jgi:hypothetical protein
MVRVGFLRHSTNLFGRSDCWPGFLLGCDHENTSGGVRMGVETVLLIVILTFVAGYLLHRWDTRRGGFGTDRSTKEQDRR